jgi:tetratricopeptide (TPR) repeat protein
MSLDDQTQRITFPPTDDLLTESQAKVLAGVLDSLTQNDFELRRLEPQIPTLIQRLGYACASVDDQSRMATVLDRFERWYRLPGYWLAFLFQNFIAQQPTPESDAYAIHRLRTYACSCVIFADAQININSDQCLPTLENAYVALRQKNDPSLNDVAALVVARMRTIFTHYRSLYSGTPYNQINPLTFSLYGQKSWHDLATVFQHLRGRSRESTPADYQRIIDQSVHSDDTWSCVVARRFLGGVYERNNQWENAAEQYKLALDVAQGAALDTEIGHLQRLYGYALRKSGRLEEAVHQFENACSHESNQLFAYWQALSLRELGEAGLGWLPRRFDPSHPPIEAKEALEGALKCYEGSRRLFDKHVASGVLPVARAVEQQMFRSYVDNGMEVAAAIESTAFMPSRPDTVAEVETSGPRYATDVMAEERAALTLGADAQAKYLRCRAIFQEHLARFNQKNEGLDFPDYLAFVEKNQEARGYYMSTRKGLTPSITQAQLSDEIAAKLLDLHVPNVGFLMMHICPRETYMGMLFPGVKAIRMIPAKIEAVRWQECDQAYQSALEDAKSRSSPRGPAHVCSALGSLLLVYEECFSSFLEVFLPVLRGNQLKVFPRFSANAVPFHALKVKGRPLIEYCDVSYGQTLGMFLQMHRDSPSLDPGTLGIVDAGILPYRGTFCMLDVGHNDRLYMLPNSSWEDVRTAISDRHVSDLFFACHGEYDRDDPAKSRLFLSDRERVVSFSEIFSKLDLTGCRSVTLGACESGIARTLVSAEYIGLPVAFLAAGAQYVIGTLWQVNQYAAAILLGHHYLFLGDGKHTVVAALNDAQRITMKMSQAEVMDWLNTFLPEKAKDVESYIRGLGDPPFAHPYYWAGFYVAGDV